MNEEKYFSVDVSDETHVIKLHETLEQAKQNCLNGANEAFEFAGDMDDFESYEANDLPCAVYGVVLGRAKSDKRPLTDEEIESGYYMAHISHIIEPPELVEVNSWIPVDSKLPEDPTKEVLAWCGYPILARYSEGDWWCYFSDEFADKTGWTKEYNITHWQSLPEPPKEN